MTVLRTFSVDYAVDVADTALDEALHDACIEVLDRWDARFECAWAGPTGSGLLEELP